MGVNSLPAVIAAWMNAQFTRYIKLMLECIGLPGSEV